MIQERSPYFDLVRCTSCEAPTKEAILVVNHARHALEGDLIKFNNLIMEIKDIRIVNDESNDIVKFLRRNGAINGEITKVWHKSWKLEGDQE